MGVNKDSEWLLVGRNEETLVLILLVFVLVAFFFFLSTDHAICYIKPGK